MNGTRGSVLMLDLVLVVSEATRMRLPSRSQEVTVCRIVMVFCSKSMASYFKPIASLRRRP